MLLAVDDSLGRILAALEKAGALDNTVIVFTSDHGYFYGEHGLNEERRLAYEETIRIPLLVRYPSRVKAGSTPAQMVLTIDLAPTLLELAGLPPPAASRVDRSCRSSERRRPTGGRRSWSSTTATPSSRESDDGLLGRAHRAHKYIEYRELQGMNELYDLEPDPYEEHNLIGRADSELAAAIDAGGAAAPDRPDAVSRYCGGGGTRGARSLKNISRGGSSTHPGQG